MTAQSFQDQTRKMQPTHSACVLSASPCMLPLYSILKKKYWNWLWLHIRKITKTLPLPPAVVPAGRCWWNLSPGKTRQLNWLCWGPTKNGSKLRQLPPYFLLVFLKNPLIFSLLKAIMICTPYILYKFINARTMQIGSITAISCKLTYVIFLLYSTHQTSGVRLFLLFFEVALKPK